MDVANISKIPPEVFSQVFLLLSTDYNYKDNLHVCLVCRLWLSNARAALYHSVVIADFKIHVFARTIEANESLVSLIRHFRLHCALAPSSADIFMDQILPALSNHQKTLRSFHLQSCTLTEPWQQAKFVKSLPLLRHLDVDTNIFPSIQAMKEFISSFPNLRSLDVNEDQEREFSEEWWDKPTRDIPPKFPPSIRSVAFHVPHSDTMRSLLNWVLHTSRPIEQFSVTIESKDNGVILGELLRSFGLGLTSLMLRYRGSLGLPTIDLASNTNLGFLRLDIFFVQDYDRMKQHLSATLGSLAPSSLRIIEVNLVPSHLSPPHFLFMDWALLDESLGDVEIRICVFYRERSQIVAASVKEEIIRQLPRRHALGRVTCTVEFYPRHWNYPF
ncbi:hypothetical protein ONZ45_g7246 [Pleurotus djamor]|nr:hypothetical protein ONZ45_g7246 [Pleurotus djamor]